jgi:hypothetical protein
MTTTQLVRAGDGLGLAISAVHRDEGRLVHAFADLADRHAVEHEIHHVARDLAGWSREHVQRLAQAGRSHGLDLDDEPGREHEWAEGLKRAAAELLVRRRAPSVMLLADLRGLHREVSGASLDWEILAQAAQASEDGELVDLASACHPQTLRQLRWTNAHVKVLSPQVVNSV